MKLWDKIKEFFYVRIRGCSAFDLAEYSFAESGMEFSMLNFNNQVVNIFKVLHVNHRLRRIYTKVRRE